MMRVWQGLFPEKQILRQTGIPDKNKSGKFRKI
jgi:hypothetical protein